MTDKSLTCNFCHVAPQGDDKRVVREGKAYCPHHTPDKTGKPVLNAAQRFRLQSQPVLRYTNSGPMKVN